MNRRLLLCLLSLLLGPWVVLGAPPNLVVIFADDLGVNDLSCYGRRDQPTPHLDRLAGAGARFTTAYAAQSICSASRAALLTGKHPARLHLTTYLPGRPDAPSQKLWQPVIEGQLPLEELTVAEHLRQAGYATACLGKWHLGGPGFGPAEQGFETVFAGSATTVPTATEGSKGEIELTAKAEEFIDAHREKPFFLYLAHNSPHIPFAATPEATQRHATAFNPTYAAVVESLDAAVGRVLAKLDATGLSDRTVVIFASDNGGLHVPEGGAPPTRNAPLRAGKGFLYEGGLRVPLLIRWPGVTPPGSVVSGPVLLTDLMPTLLDAAGLEVGKVSSPLDGVSLRPVLAGGPAPVRKLHWHFPHYTNQGGRPAGAIRDGRWKLIEHFEDQSVELFDLDADPSEATNRATLDPDVAAGLQRQLAQWRDRIGAQPCRPNPAFNAALHTAVYEKTDVSRAPAGSTAVEVEREWREWRLAMNAAVKGAPIGLTPPTGDIRLRAADAQVHGRNLRYEPPPFKNTLGYWTEVGDWVDWPITIASAGRYEIEIQQGCGDGQGGSEVEIAVGGQSARFTVQETGHFQNFIQRTVGEVTLAAGAQTLAVKPVTKAHAAVMDLRRVVLRPLPAGDR